MDGFIDPEDSPVRINCTDTFDIKFNYKKK